MGQHMGCCSTSSIIVCANISGSIYIYICIERESYCKQQTLHCFLNTHMVFKTKKRNISCTNSLHAHMLDITIPASASCLHCFFVWFIGLSTCVGLWVAGLGCWHWGWVDAFLAGLGSIYVEWEWFMGGLKMLCRLCKCNIIYIYIYIYIYRSRKKVYKPLWGCMLCAFACYKQSSSAWK